MERPINARCRGGRTVQRDSLCGGGVRVPQVGQERSRKGDGTTRQGNGKTKQGKIKMVRENCGKKEQDSVTTTEAPGCKQRPGRRKRRVTQPEGGHGRPRGPRGAGAETSGLLRTVRRDEKIHGHRNRGDRVRVWIFYHQVANMILPRGHTM